MKDRWGDDTTGEGGKAAALDGVWRAERDLGSLSTITRAYGAQAVWATRDAAGRTVTGKGVTVAVIDTGVAAVPGLDAPGKVLNGPDLSYDSQQAGTRYVDGYGHGTHMAAIVAGRDSAVRAGTERDPRHFVGVAPDARILSVKVGASDGGADVSQVIAAVDWVVAHRAETGTRVINLSYGTLSQQPAAVDPLARAVENAWRKGIVVVASAGNDGLASPRLAMPAEDPYVIAVGAVDHRGTPDPRDDQVGSFTNGGSTARRPDVLAPGKSVVSLRVPGSDADRHHPEGRLPGDAAGRFFRGSGTSQAAAVVSGSVALLLQARPSLTPDQVKALLRGTADPLAVGHPAMGAGVIDLKGALAAPAPTARQAWPASTGLGTLEASRGGDHVVDPANGRALFGEVDALGAPFSSARWVAASTAGTAWSGGAWNGRTWTGTGWATGGWAPAAWTGTSWSGLDWSTRSWSADAWAARSWRGTDFLARSWRGSTWLARSWRGF
ncbi:peptidase S8 and S53 subtilisin kexin sedolisin [Vallicoccus soli]|uniref:Peptidase S8 and S53 subtilisin kexin sedolisin n=1 Tax=Vallicoccus soli TaxID=2339232 RepID=A0A3A3Z6B3_9ACTN|nr:peptidase S8 and S53 subtilisin kexin sedolisin [Vallicoccus soli]